MGPWATPKNSPKFQKKSKKIFLLKSSQNHLKRIKTLFEKKLISFRKILYFPLYCNFGPLLSLNQQCSEKMAWSMFSCYPTISIREPSSEKMCPLVDLVPPGLQNEPKSRKISKKIEFFQQNGYNQKK